MIKISCQSTFDSKVRCIWLGLMLLLDALKKYFQLHIETTKFLQYYLDVSIFTLPLFFADKCRLQTMFRAHSPSELLSGKEVS